MIVEPSVMTRPWWEAVERRELTRPVCDRCGRSFFSPQFACSHCQSTAWRYVESGGTGVVYSHTTIWRAPTPEFDAPYVLSIVDLDGEGWHLLTRVVGCPPEDVTIGMPVKLTWDTVGDRTMPVFEPAG